MERTVTPLNYFIEWTEREGYYYFNSLWWDSKNEGSALSTEQLFIIFNKKANEKRCTKKQD